MKKSNADNKLSIVCCIILLIPLVALSSVGLCMYYSELGSADQYTLATCTDVFVDEYLYAPYGGGRVTMENTTHITYEFGVNGKTYRFAMVEYKEPVSIPQAIPVRYNATNDEIIFYDYAEYYNTIAGQFVYAEPDWRRVWK